MIPIMTLQELHSALLQAIENGADPHSPVAIHDSSSDSYLVLAGVNMPEPTYDGSGYVWFTLEPGFELDSRFHRYAYDHTRGQM